MKLLKLIFLLFLPIFTLKAQITEKGYSTFKCFYTYQYQPFNQDTTKFQDKFLLICNDDFSIFDNYTYFLLSKALSDDFENRNLNGNSSVFSILATNTKDLQEPDANNFSVMKDYTTKEATYIYNLGYIANCTFTENYGELNWTITDQSKIIKGYNCFLATTIYGNYEIEAWFTPEVPVSDGPYLFGGLPGLIVLLNDKNNIHSFSIGEMIEDKTIMLKDKVTGRELFESVGFKKAFKNMKKKRQQLELGYDIEKVNPFLKSSSLPKLEDTSPENIKKLKLKYSLYDNLFFKFYDPKKEL